MFGYNLNKFNGVLIIWFLFLSFHRVADAASKKPCASCVGLKTCEPFMTFINQQKKPLHPAIVKYLNEKECGFSGGFPRVCCEQIPGALAEKCQKAPKFGKNNLSVVRDEEEEKNVTLPQRKRQRIDKIVDHFRSVAQMEFLNDFFEPFDFFRRKRGSGDRLDIEIR